MLEGAKPIIVLDKIEFFVPSNQKNKYQNLRNNIEDFPRIRCYRVQRISHPFLIITEFA
jgi:hypothetical protein